MFSITVEKRDMKVRPADIKKSGKIPAIFYGPKEVSTPIVISLLKFKEMWKKAGESSVVVLNEGKNEHEALIHEIDVHPVTGEPRHVDFYVIEKGKKVTVHVPLVFSGVSPAVKDKGGILVKVMREIEVEAAPKDLPREIAVDISSLIELNSKIAIKDIKVAAGVTLKAALEEIVASISEAKEEVVEAPTAIDMSSIEVEAKGKEVKEGEAGAAGAPGAAASGDKKDDKKAGGDKKGDKK